MIGLRLAHILTISVGVFALSPVFAQAPARPAPTSGSPSLTPGALSAKALLEDLLVRRYSQELSTKVERGAFSLGAQLDLVEVPPKVVDPATSVPEEPLSDLMLGTLDPEELMKKYAAPDERAIAKAFLDNYRIRAVAMSVGLKDDLAPEVKAEVDKWLSARLKGEFGAVGKGLVSLIKAPVDKKVPGPKNIWEWLDRFQALAGQLVMALAVILGVILWKLFSSSKPTNVLLGGESKVTNEGGAGAQNAAAAPSETVVKRDEMDEGERLALHQEINQLNQRLNELLPRISKDIESVVRSWCQMGELGRLRLAFFAEAVGKELGKLPIPVDAIGDVTKMFAKMSEIGIKEKRDVLQKTYWDLLSALNLGPEALSQPFGYLGGLNLGLIDQVLMDQNPKMKTLVSLYMPSDLRKSYVQSLSVESKKELLLSAAGLSEIAVDELRSLDKTLMGKVKPGGNTNVVPLERTLNKLLVALTPIEEVTLLSGMTGPAVESFKRTTPSLAFLGEWPDDKLGIFLARALPDEVVGYAQVRLDMKDRILSLCAPMTAEMASEELARPDTSSDKVKNQRLEKFSQRLKNMVAQKEINLEEVFSKAPEAGKDGTLKVA